MVTEEIKKYDENYDLPIDKDDLDENMIFNDGEANAVSH